MILKSILVFHLATIKLVEATLIVFGDKEICKVH